MNKKKYINSKIKNMHFSFKHSYSKDITFFLLNNSDFHLSLRLNTSLESGFDLINLGQKYREGPTIFSPSKINACLMKNGESHNKDNWGEKNIFSKCFQFSQLIS